MTLSDIRRAWQGGLASIVVGLGRDAAPLDHLGPHNAFEWALYLGLFALVVAVGFRAVRSRDDTLPQVRRPRRRKPRPGHAPKLGVGPATPASDEWFDDGDPGS